MRAWIICIALFLTACLTVIDSDDHASIDSENHASVHSSSVSVFVVAHQDDWQLFMNPQAFQSMDEPGEKAVFIHLTAGDGGQGNSGKPIPYYLAREEGALRAVRFMANAKSDPSLDVVEMEPTLVERGAKAVQRMAYRFIPKPKPHNGLGVEMERTLVERGGKVVQRIAYSNAVVYFLRLPDGNVEGPGFKTTGWQSLERLRTGEIAEIEAIDGSSSYDGWNDLIRTLAEIVQSEMQTGEELGLHIFEQDIALNPGDHSDHRNTALAMEAVALRFPCANVYRYDGYITSDRDENVVDDDLMIDVGSWAATASGLSDNYASSTWDPAHNSWLGRSYWRVVMPDASCSTSPE